MRREPDWLLPLDTKPMEALLAEDLPEGDWQFEPKWDGFRCLAYRAGDRIELIAKSGKPLTRYFPELVTALRALTTRAFVLDGEIILLRNDEIAFDALQMRLHPAESRIRRLAAETPAMLVLFDVLALEERVLLNEALVTRREILEAFMKREHHPAGVLLSPATESHRVAQRWLDSAGESGTDGVVAKALGEIYRPGERAMVKVKPARTADCVVGGFRYRANENQVGSLLLGLYDESGLLDHVGFTATISNAERPRLTKQLEALRKAPGFTGRAPGGPSRWSTERSAEWQPLRPELVVEVRFDQVTAGRFRHGTKLVRWRPDKAPRQCTYEQIKPPASLSRILDLAGAKHRKSG